MPDLDRRTVKPAHADAYIPDPARGDKLPAEGREVAWSHYWQHHLDKENVVLAGGADWAAAWASQLAKPAAEAPPAADPAH